MMLTIMLVLQELGCLVEKVKNVSPVQKHTPFVEFFFAVNACKFFCECFFGKGVQLFFCGKSCKS